MVCALHAQTHIICGIFALFKLYERHIERKEQKMPEIIVDTFDFAKTIRQQPSINVVLLGKRNTGKSTMISEMMHEFNKGGIKRFVVFSQQEAKNCHYRKLGVPSRYIYTAWNENILKRIYDAQGKMKEAKMSGELPADLDIRLVVVIDDFAFDRNTFRSKFMSEVFMNGRHSEVTLVMALQDPMAIPPAGRDNLDVVVTLRQPNMKLRKKIFDNYPNAFDEFSEFERTIRHLTNNYGAMVFNNLSNDNAVNKTLFHFRAKPGRTIARLGSPAWRQYRDAVKRDIYMEDISTKVKNHSNLKVKINEKDKGKAKTKGKKGKAK